MAPATPSLGLISQMGERGQRVCWDVSGQDRDGVSSGGLKNWNSWGQLGSSVDEMA